MRRWIAAVMMLAAPLSARGWVQPAWEAVGEGTITDATHPARPGDFRTYHIRIRVAMDEGTGEAEISVVDKDRPTEPPDRYFWRRGRVFQSNDKGVDLPPAKEADLSAAAIAVIHPGLLAGLERERPENIAGTEGGVRYISNMDVLWEGRGEPIRSLTRRVHHDVLGSTTERVEHEGATTTVTVGDRRVAVLEFGPPTPLAKVRTPAGDSKRDEAMVIPPEEFVFRELGGGLFACELARANSRVFIVEFAEDVLIFEGVYTTRNAETLARAVKARFGKPARSFCFSHIHGQYIGGVRAWAAEGATVLAPPSTVPLAERALAAPFGLRPDAWSRLTRPAKVEAVPERWAREDASASVLVLNDKESEHTDEYLLVYLPRTRTLLTGDLLFYRPGRPLTGRSLTLARHIAKLGLAVDRCVTTWPLEWPGVKSEVTGEELRAGTKGP